MHRVEEGNAQPENNTEGCGSSIVSGAGMDMGVDMGMSMSMSSLREIELFG